MIFPPLCLSGGINLTDGYFKTIKHKNLSAWLDVTGKILLFCVRVWVN